MNIIVPIPGNLLADVMVTAFEGGSNYWIDSVETLNLSKTNPWYADEDFWDRDFEVKVTPNDGEDPVVFTRQDLERALISLPRSVAGRIASEGYDADDADILLQRACFGEVIYG